MCPFTMKEIFNKRILVIIVTYAVTIHSVNATNYWTWRCNAVDETCIRQIRANDTQHEAYSSVEICRLVCGKYGSLWPKPTGKTIISNVFTPFLTSSLQFIFSFNDSEVTEYIQLTTKRFRESILPQSSNNCSRFQHNLTVSITIESNITDLTWQTNERYSLQINTRESVLVEINAFTVFGARHALETLSQLIELDINDDSSMCNVITSQATITDGPYYQHRGLLLDTARNFLSISSIKKHLDGMASCKLNILHWHITDSQSFPLELSSVPNMTKYGAYSNKKIYQSNDIKDIIKYAKLRGIRVIMEIDTPSHSGNGWQWGPDAGLGTLALCIDKQPWRSYCIEPPCGQLNPINENLYSVLKKIYSDILDFFDNTEAFHMGGDEIFIPCWNSTPEIIEYLKDKPRNTKTFLDLWSEFQKKALDSFDSAAANSNTSIIIWTSQLTQPDVITQYLAKDRYVIQTWEPAANSLPKDLLKLGYRIIVSTKDAWYLDHGFWGKTVYHNWQVVYDNKIPTDVGTIGGEVCMWSEFVDEYSIESKVWPRAAAAAERLWSNPTSNAKKAARRFYRHRERLISKNIHADAVTPKWCYQNENQCI